MTNSRISILQKMMALLILFGITGLFLLCLAVPFMNISGMKDGMPCGMDHVAEFCPMTLNEHLSFWQKIVIPISSSTSFLFLLVTMAMFVVSLKDAATLEALRRLKFIHYHIGASPLFDYLRQQFSYGILHSKIY